MNIRNAALAAAVTVALVACSGSDTPQSSEPEPKTSDPQTTTQTTAGSANLIDQVRRTFAERGQMPPDQVKVGDPHVLAPSTCLAVPAWREELDHGTAWFVQISDGSLIEGGDDEALAQVAQSCYLDQGTVPDPDAATSLVLDVGPALVVEPLDATDGPRVLEPLGVEWEPPSVTATGDGFDISFYVQNVEIFKVYQVTSTISPGQASTDYRALD